MTTALVLCMGAVLLLPALVLTKPTFAWAAGDESSVEVSENGKTARLAGATVAIDDFMRLNKGTSKAIGEQELGYHYRMAGATAFAVLLISDDLAVVYYDKDLAGQLDFNPDNLADKSSFIKMITALDAASATGGNPMSNKTVNYRFTTKTEYLLGDFCYRFGVAGDDGNYYCTVTATANSDPSNSDSSKAAQFCLTGYLVAPASVKIVAAPEGFAAFAAFISSIDMRPFWVSLKTAGAAMIFIFIAGILAARLSLRMNPRLQGILDSLFTIPMVLPPTVCGFLLLVLLGNSTAFGRWLVEHGIELVFSWPSAVIAAAVVGFPLMYRTVRGAFESQDANLFDAARTLGWSEGRIFFRLMLPLAWPSIAAGTVLAFARAMGEFGATLFVAGNYPGITQTMPIAIYFQWMGGHSDVAIFWVIVTIVLSFLVILFINWYSVHLQKYKKKSKKAKRSKVQINSNKEGTRDVG